MAKEQVRYDVDGFDAVTAALRDIVNQYPGLTDGEEISFSTLSANHGKAMFPVSGAIIETEKKYVTGKIEQVCLYPFYVVYRASGLSEDRKASIKEWLDTLGKWLERQTVNINEAAYRLHEYPTLSGNRKFLSISRQTPGYLESVEKNGAENWAIFISARYQNRFYSIA